MDKQIYFDFASFEDYCKSNLEKQRAAKADADFNRRQAERAAERDRMLYGSSPADTMTFDTSNVFPEPQYILTDSGTVTLNPLYKEPKDTRYMY